MTKKSLPRPTEQAQDILDSRSLSVSDAAKILGVNRVNLSRLLNGRAGMSPDMAVRFGLAFGVDAEALAYSQLEVDLAVARSRIDVSRWKGGR